MKKPACYMSSTHMTCGNDWVKCVERAKEMGFDGVELFSSENGVNLVDMPTERLLTVAKRAKEMGITLSLHPWTDWAWLDVDDMILKYRQLFETAAKMGVREVNMHMEFLTNREKGLDRLFAATDACIELLHRYDIMLYYENVPDHAVRLIGSELKDFDKLFEYYKDEKSIMLNIDSGHAHITKTTEELVKKYGARWKYTHINDNGGYEDDHVAPSDGTLDFEAFAMLAAGAGYTGPLMMEYHENGLEKGMKTLKAAYGKAGYELTDIKP